jgi:acyl-CoA reductase-like NAD-dependent aldehyde dehydrogenase
VLKPSEEASLVGLKIAEVFDKPGLPPGVLSVVTGEWPDGCGFSIRCILRRNTKSLRP